jgi:hypothetical protein
MKSNKERSAVSCPNSRVDQTWLGGIGYHAAFTVMDQLEGLFRP